MPDKGHIELERQIDSITVGVRHRRDLGDMSALMRSIEEVGLLQPITVTPGRGAGLWVAAPGGDAPARQAHLERVGPLRNLRSALAPARPAGRERAA